MLLIWKHNIFTLKNIFFFLSYFLIMFLWNLQYEILILYYVIKIIYLNAILK